MIRVNMLRDASGGGGRAAQSGVSIDNTSAAPRESAGGQADLALKVIFLVVPLALTWAYRSYQIGVRSEEKQKLEAHVNELTEKLRSFEPGIKDIEKFQEEKRKLDNQLDVIKRL